MSEIITFNPDFTGVPLTDEVLAILLGNLKTFDFNLFQIFPKAKSWFSGYFNPDFNVNSSDLILLRMLNELVGTFRPLNPFNEDTTENIFGFTNFVLLETQKWEQNVGDIVEKGVLKIYSPKTIERINQFGLNNKSSVLFDLFIMFICYGLLGTLRKYYSFASIDILKTKIGIALKNLELIYFYYTDQTYLQRLLNSYTEI